MKRRREGARRVPPVAGCTVATVIDCGTSGVRALVAEVGAEGIRVLEDLSQPVELSRVFTTGRLDGDALDQVEAAVGGVLAVAAGYGPGPRRAVATSAVREAQNRDLLVERLRARHGLELEVIEGSEEARLYVEALRQLLSHGSRRLDGDALFVEVGAGGSCIGMIRDGKLVHSADEHYGALRILDDFAAMRDATDFALSVDRNALGAARMILRRLPQPRPAHLVVNGGELERLLDLAGVPAGPLAELPVTALEAWWSQVQGAAPSRRAELCGCSEREAALLLPAAALVRHLAREAGIAAVLMPGVSLRGGLIADFLPGATGPHHLGREDLLAEAMGLVARYGGDAEYARNTASLAVQLFDGTATLHGLGQRERLLLEFAALVHDVGSYINVRNRHKHTWYIITGSDIAGLSLAEKEMVAHIARYHRKSPPEPHHLEYQRLPRRERVAVAQLAALLRLAYSLDVERSQRIRRVRCEVARDRLLLRVDRRQVALERWTLAGKAGMFEELFGLDVVLVPREED